MKLLKGYKYKVSLPKWWTDGENIIGYTDKADTYCCDSTPCWYVLVPSMDYSGYFAIDDLELI